MTLAEEKIAYLELLLDQVNEGWRPIEKNQQAESNQAYGVRIESSTWLFVGADVNHDILYFSETNELGVFTTIGGQVGAGGGSGITVGVLSGENLPERASYGGPTTTIAGATASVPLIGVTLEADQALGAPNSDGSIPTTTYYGVGGSSTESGIYQGAGYTIDWFGIAESIFDIFD